MSTTLHLAAPASSTCTRYCGKHPQERVVGVCSACLANKLSSLIYSNTAYAPEDLDNFSVPSPLTNSPPVSINSPTNHHHPHQDHLQTINEEADSTTQESNNEGLLYSTLEAPFTAVEVCAETKLEGNNSVHSSGTKEQISLTYDVVPLIEEENPINHDISVSSINEEVRSDNLEEGKPKANQYLRANKPIKCKRSKSLSGLRGESLIKLQKEAHEYESGANTKGEQSNTGAKKVTLRTLFQLDDEEKWRNRALMAAHTSESELDMHEFSADHKLIEAEFDKGSIDHAKQIEDATDVHDNHTHNSYRCVPSASTLSSSVCPSIPCKFKHSVLLNSLLCRKTGDEKKGSGSIRRPSQVHEASRNIFIRGVNEGGLTKARDEGGFIRATYIASESREPLRRCRSKLERSVARSSVSSSQPASPPCVSHGVDMKSERKFNLTARALAAEFPSFLCSSAEAVEAMMIFPSKIEDPSGSATQTEDLQGDQDSRICTHNDSVKQAVAIMDSLQSSKVLAKPVIQLDSSAWEEHYRDYSIPNLAEEAERGKEMENGSGNRQNQDDEDVEQGEMPLPMHIIPTVNRAAATMVTIRANLEEVQEGADAVEELEEAECRNGIPTYITATESFPASEEVAMAVCGRSLSCRSSSGKAIAAAGQQGTHKVPEEYKHGGVWEAYSNKSGKFPRKWPSSSRTVKIAPDQSGLLRFYLTPLRASGRTRFSSATRRPPKRHFWSLVFV